MDQEDEEDAAAALQTVAGLRKEAAKIQRAHDNIVIRETRVRLAEARTNFFKDASGRQLRGEVCLLLLMPLTSNESISRQQLQSALPWPSIQLIISLVGIFLCHFNPPAQLSR